jgi:ribonuclease Y
MRAGRGAEQRRLTAARSGAEETARRIVQDGEREAETLRKGAVLAGKEELMKAREGWEEEVRHRREELEREERRLQERELSVDRRSEAVEQRDKEISRRFSELGRREKTIADRDA